MHSISPPVEEPKIEDNVPDKSPDWTLTRLLLTSNNSLIQKLKFHSI